MVPDENGMTPGYQQLDLKTPDIEGKLAVVASGISKHRNDAAIGRNRWATLHVGRLQPGQSVNIPDAPYAHIYLARVAPNSKRPRRSTSATQHGSPVPGPAASRRPCPAKYSSGKCTPRCSPALILLLLVRRQ